MRVRAVDSAGNADPSPATYSWIVDRAGVFGHPSMITDVVAEGGNKQVYIQQYLVVSMSGVLMYLVCVLHSIAFRFS